MANLRGRALGRLPWTDAGPVARSRGFRLTCLTSPKADLWSHHAHTFDDPSWSSSDARLQLEGPVESPAVWDHPAGVRTEFAGLTLKSGRLTCPKPKNAR